MTCPISGTIARGKDRSRMPSACARLLNPPRTAELTRGYRCRPQRQSRVAVPGSVKVSEGTPIELYSHPSTREISRGELGDGAALSTLLPNCVAVTGQGAPSRAAISSSRSSRRARGGEGGAARHVGVNGSTSIPASPGTSLPDGCRDQGGSDPRSPIRSPRRGSADAPNARRSSARGSCEPARPSPRQTRGRGSSRCASHGRRSLFVDCEDSPSTPGSYFRATGAEGPQNLRHGIAARRLLARVGILSCARRGGAAGKSSARLS